MSQLGDVWGYELFMWSWRPPIKTMSLLSTALFWFWEVFALKSGFPHSPKGSFGNKELGWSTCLHVTESSLEMYFLLLFPSFCSICFKQSVFFRRSCMQSFPGLNIELRNHFYAELDRTPPRRAEDIQKRWVSPFREQIFTDYNLQVSLQIFCFLLLRNWKSQ